MTSAQRSGLDAAERSGLPGPPAKGLRRDAQRNRDAIVAAAREVFSGQGLEAPLEEIARRAGVGIGTLYRRFPTRVELVERQDRRGHRRGGPGRLAAPSGLPAGRLPRRPGPRAPRAIADPAAGLPGHALARGPLRALRPVTTYLFY